MRKYHRKTRTGCSQCKQRRIKCDETKPSCSNCTRRGVGCSLAFLTPSAPTTRYQFQFRDKIAAVTNNGALNTTQLLNSTSKTPNLSLAPANVELFQHYTTVAHQTISGQARCPELWEKTVPQIALQFPFLMHGMLALSALHLSVLHPTRRREMITKASWNESQALPSYRKIMGHPNDENVHAIFVFSGFVSQYSLAASHTLGSVDGKSGIPHETIDDLSEFPPNWFHIIRGTSVMVYRYYLLLIRGPFARVLTQQPNDIPFEENPDDKHLTALEELFFPAVYSATDHSPGQTSERYSSTTPPSSDAFDSTSIDAAQAKREAELHVYAKTLYDLRRTFILRYSPCRTIDDLSACFIFPGIVDKPYLHLLNDRRPEALILFAHYCVLLDKCDYAWYLRGVGKRLIAAIWHSLGVEWRRWILWPVAVTGAIVDTDEDDEDDEDDGGFVEEWIEEQGG